MYAFRWNDWNVEHIGKHGVSPDEAECVVNFAGTPYPESLGDGKYLVVGQTRDGQYVQVVYVFDPPGVIFVIHARPLRDREKRRFRRRRRS